MSELWAEFEQKLAAEDARFEDFGLNSDWRQILSDLGFSAIKAGKLMKMIEQNAPPPSNSSPPSSGPPPSNSSPPAPSINMDDIARHQIEATIRNMQGHSPSNVGPAQNQRTLPAVPSTSQSPPRDLVQPQAFIPANLSLGLTTVQQSSAPIALPAQMASQHGTPGIVRAVVQIEKSDLTPKIDSSKLQVTLGWADHPQDLDLHCVAVGNGVNRHVFYNHKNDTNIALDVDVEEGQGPETVTITKEPNVTYYFSVHHYSGESSIPKSGAWLRVSEAGGGHQTFHVPRRFAHLDTKKMFWLAFSVRNGVISPKNTFVAADTSEDPPIWGKRKGFA